MREKSILDSIGNTPLVKLKNVATGYEIFAKLEFLNPTGSIKDRIALYMIEDAERKGLLKPGYTVVEATSGNTGLAVALVATTKGYKSIFVMPEDLHSDQRKILEKIATELIFTPGPESEMRRAREKAEEIAYKNPDIIYLGQHKNPANPKAHEETTGEEIWSQMDGKIDAFVAGIGTGGTITGVSRALKKHNPNIWVVGLEPYESRTITKGEKGDHLIEGIGDGMIPEVLDMGVVDEVIAIRSREAIEMTKQLAREEGIYAGISSGCNVLGAVEIAKRLGKESRVATIMPDDIHKYLDMLF